MCLIVLRAKHPNPLCFAGGQCGGHCGGQCGGQWVANGWPMGGQCVPRPSPTRPTRIPQMFPSRARSLSPNIPSVMCLPIAQTTQAESNAGETPDLKPQHAEFPSQFGPRVVDNNVLFPNPGAGEINEHRQDTQVLHPYPLFHPPDSMLTSPKT